MLKARMPACVRQGTRRSAGVREVVRGGQWQRPTGLPRARPCPGPPPRARARRGHSRAGGSRPRVALGMLRRRPGRGASELPCRPPVRPTWAPCAPGCCRYGRLGPARGGSERWLLRSRTRGAHPTPTRSGTQRTRGRTSGKAGSPRSPRHVGHPGGAGQDHLAGLGRGADVGGKRLGVLNAAARAWACAPVWPSLGLGAELSVARRGGARLRGSSSPRSLRLSHPGRIRLQIAKMAFSGPGTNFSAKPIRPVLRATGLASLLTCGNTAALCGERARPGNTRPRLLPPKLITNLRVAFKKFMRS